MESATRSRKAGHGQEQVHPFAPREARLPTRLSVRPNLQDGYVEDLCFVGVSILPGFPSTVLGLGFSVVARPATGSQSRGPQQEAGQGGKEDAEMGWAHGDGARPGPCRPWSKDDIWGDDSHVARSVGPDRIGSMHGFASRMTMSF